VAWSFTIPRPDGDLSSTLAFLSETEYHYLEVRLKAGAALLGSQGDHYSAVWWYLDKQTALEILELPDDAANLFQAIKEYPRSLQRDDVCDGISTLLKVLARFVNMNNRQPFPATINKAPRELPYHRNFVTIFQLAPWEEKPVAVAAYPQQRSGVSDFTLLELEMLLFDKTCSTIPPFWRPQFLAL
jgi:hypothetical protein